MEGRLDEWMDVGSMDDGYIGGWVSEYMGGWVSG